jgi:uncharacterized membrane protein YbhN (UPF0104 family)
MGKKIQRKNALMLAVGVVIITLLLAFKLDLSTFVATVSENISLGFYILISLSITLQLVCRAFRFNLLYNRIQPDRMSFKNSLLLTGASFLVAMATPNKLGDTSRGLFFREKGVEVTAVTVIEYLFDTFAVVGIALVGTAAVYRRYLAIPVVTMLLLIAGLVGLYYLLERDVLARLPDRFTRLRNLAGKLQAFKIFFGAGLKSRFVLGAGLLFTGLFHAIYFLLFYAVLSQLKTGVALTDVLFSAGVGMFVGALTFIPMGIGTRDASTYGLLCSVGVDPHAAMASVIIMRSLTVWLILGSAVCYFAAVRTIARR